MHKYDIEWGGDAAQKIPFVAQQWNSISDIEQSSSKFISWTYNDAQW